MCAKCSRLTKRLRLREPGDLFELAERLAPYVEDGVLEVLQASSPLLDVRRDLPLRERYFYSLRCTRCGREFQLIMDTQRGAGDWG